jgi:hypothetical protein
MFYVFNEKRKRKRKRKNKTCIYYKFDKSVQKNMEVAIPLVALGSLYFLSSNKNKTKNASMENFNGGNLSASSPSPFSIGGAEVCTKSTTTTTSSKSPGLPCLARGSASSLAAKRFSVM